MKKTLLTFLFGASLIFGVNQLKAQNIGTKFYNKDEDEFKEEVVGYWQEGFNEKTNRYIRPIMGVTIIYYVDKNNDNFHEFIRVFNCDKKRRLIIEDFEIDKNTGLIDYSFKGYFLDQGVWNKRYSHKTWLELVKRSPYGALQEKKININLTGQDFYEMGMDKRVKNLINVYKDETKLKKMLEQERSYWKSLPSSKYKVL